MNSTNVTSMCPPGETPAVTQAEKGEHMGGLHGQVLETSATRQKRRPPPPVSFPQNPGLREFLIVRKPLEQREPSAASLERLSRRPITFSSRKTFQLSDDPESHHSSRPSSPSSTTKKGSTNHLPSLPDPWAGAAKFLTSAGHLEKKVNAQLSRMSPEPTTASCHGCDVDGLAQADVFTIAAIEFSRGLDIDALINPEYVLEDHDDLKEQPQVFPLAPHAYIRNCGCHYCMMWTDGSIWDLEEHQGNIWCDCMKCARWNEDERQRYIRKLSEERAEMLRQRIRDARRELPGEAEGEKQQAGEPSSAAPILDNIAESEVEASRQAGCFPGWITTIARFLSID